MKLKLLSAVSTMEPENSLQNKGRKALEESLKRFGWDYHFIVNPALQWDNWGGWPYIVEWLKANRSEYTHVIFTDGFDTLALSGQAEAEEKLKKMLEPNPDAFIYSTEKHWFPHPTGWEAYNQKFIEKTKDLSPNLRWRYVNGGQFAGSIDAAIRWYEQAPKDQNNQAWANMYYSQSTDNSLILDFNCELFQTLSHSGPNHWAPDEFMCTGDAIVSAGANLNGEYNISHRLYNQLTNSWPCFVHNNGIKDTKEAQFMYDILGL